MRAKLHDVDGALFCTAPGTAAATATAPGPRKPWGTNAVRPIPIASGIALEFSPMGWAIGASVGIARGNPRYPVACITGDGSYLMNGQELTTAVAESLPVVFIILNDSAYGMVMHGQRLAGAEPIAFELPRVDFRKQAEAMGVPAHVIEDPRDFDSVDFEALLSRQGPTLLDVRIDREETPPMVMRLKTLGSIKD